MDHVIAFYNVSKEVEPTVAQGPSAVPIEHFLHTLSRLKRALDYFERNNPKSIEVENVRRVSLSFSVGWVMLHTYPKAQLSK